jgi:zinc finger/BTB domain-containing protein 40
MLSISSETVSPEASLRAVLSKAMEKSVSASVVCHLLCSVHKSFPGLQPLMQELAHVGKEQGLRAC